MSEPSTLCLSITLPTASLEAWRDASLAPPQEWNDWAILGAQSDDFILWQRIGAVRVSSILNDLKAKGQREGSFFETSGEGRYTLTALLAAENWREQLLLLGAVRMLERFGAADGWALMHDYVFERAGTAWAVRFPIHGRAELTAAAPQDIKDAADAIVDPLLAAARARTD
ncbi:hypothetical protein BC777_3896 [Yoonia maricola]|uniref:Uncharacterized protein n=1 Tax=Yoonia maricola TaxID=420999 RepID=A0A2M8W0A3_9RHOB|nr:hypothetical protein [Yoonia maricola]PJI84354.1 hypothetical protein BC777_3896 [Yoonia maricola]